MFRFHHNISEMRNFKLFSLFECQMIIFEKRSMCFIFYLGIVTVNLCHAFSLRKKS